MRSVVLTIGALLFAVAILYAGNGLQSTFLALRANSEGFPLSVIGFLMSAYFAGFILGCRLIPKMVADVGHIRVFTALASIASTSALAHALWIDAGFWLVLRMITGFCFAGLAMIVESWINERAPSHLRGRVLALYRIVDLGALTIGQWLLTLAPPESFALFAVVSILVSLALVPIALTRSPQPQPISTGRLAFKSLWHLSPLAASGSLLIGLANTSFWSLAPVFASRLGFDIPLIASFMSTAILGGALSQWPLGLLSDKKDRRLIIAATATGAGIFSLLLFFLSGHSSLLLLLTFGLGAMIMPLFGLCVAHANDHTPPDQYVSTNASLLFLYGFGAIFGPLIGSVFMKAFGASALFLNMGLIFFLFVFIAFWRFQKAGGKTPDLKEKWVPISRTTPELFALDPRLNVTPDSPKKAP